MRILLIEDDKKLSFAITEQLQKEGNITDCCYDGETALHYALNPDLLYDIVLLDRMLPVIDGLTILRAMRQKNITTPVLMMTALGELDDRITGLDCGADDYLIKPFYIQELLARVRALTRRPADIVDRKTLSAFGLTLYPENRRLTNQGRSVILTPKESELIKAFLEKPDKTLSRSELLWKAWGGDAEVENGNIDTRETLNKSPAAVSGSFPPTLRYRKREIHTVFHRFRCLDWPKNLPPTALADLIRASLAFIF